MNVETPFLDVPAFIRVVELKSFTRAADAMGTSQSAVSQAVSRLEKRLGVLLREHVPTQVLTALTFGTICIETLGVVPLRQSEDADAGTEPLLGMRA